MQTQVCKTREEEQSFTKRNGYRRTRTTTNQLDMQLSFYRSLFSRGEIQLVTIKNIDENTREKLICMWFTLLGYVHEKKGLALIKACSGGYIPVTEYISILVLIDFSRLKIEGYLKNEVNHNNLPLNSCRGNSILDNLYNYSAISVRKET